MSTKKKISTENDRIDSDDDDNTTGRVLKVTKTDMIQPPSLLVDRLLAEKLDKLRLNRPNEKIKFVPNRPRQRYMEPGKQGMIKREGGKPILKPRDFVIDRLNSRYDTLVPELNRKKPIVKLINIVSMKESMELASAQAKKQMERQLQLNSVSGNLQIKHNKSAILKRFQFNDGYEMPSSRMEEPTTSASSNTSADEFDSQGCKFLNTDIDKPYSTYASITSKNLRSRVADRKAEILRKIQLHNQFLNEKPAESKPNIEKDMEIESKDRTKPAKGRGKNVRFEDSIQEEEEDNHKRHTPQINEEPRDIKPIIKKDQEIDMELMPVDKLEAFDIFAMGSDDEVSDDDGRLD